MNHQRGFFSVSIDFNHTAFIFPICIRDERKIIIQLLLLKNYYSLPYYNNDHYYYVNCFLLLNNWPVSNPWFVSHDIWLVNEANFCRLRSVYKVLQSLNWGKTCKTDIHQDCKIPSIYISFRKITWFSCQWHMINLPLLLTQHKKIIIWIWTSVVTKLLFCGTKLGHISWSNQFSLTKNMYFYL